MRPLSLTLAESAHERGGCLKIVTKIFDIQRGCLPAGLRKIIYLPHHLTKKKAVSNITGENSQEGYFVMVK